MKNIRNRIYLPKSKPSSKMKMEILCEMIQSRGMIVFVRLPDSLVDQRIRENLENLENWENLATNTSPKRNFFQKDCPFFAFFLMRFPFIIIILFF